MQEGWVSGRVRWVVQRGREVHLSCPEVIMYLSLPAEILVMTRSKMIVLFVHIYKSLGDTH